MDPSRLAVEILVFAIPTVSLCYAGVGGLFLSRKDRRAWPFAFLMFAAAVYSFGYFLELRSPSLEVMVAVRNFELLGALLLPATGLTFAAELTKRRLPWPIVAGLVGLSLALWALLVTNPAHGWFYRSVGIALGTFSVPVTQKGPGYYAFLLYVGVFLGVSSLWLFRSWRQAGGRARRGLRVAFWAFQIPWIAVAAIVVGADDWVDPVPGAIMTVCLVFLVNEVRNGMFDWQILQWVQTFQGVAEAALLVDGQGTAVASNDRAKALFGPAPTLPFPSVASGPTGVASVPWETSEGTRWFLVNRSDYGPGQHWVSVLLVDVTEQKRGEDRVRSLLEEKDLLLKEVHHRIKNHMSTIIGLFTLQADSLSEPSAVSALQEASRRVQTMMVLYDKLFVANQFQRLSAAEYVGALADEVLASFPGRAAVRVDKSLDDFPLEVDTIQPLGMLLNEVLTNVMKYAFQGRDAGRVHIGLQRRGDEAELTVADNGVGMVACEPDAPAQGFGLKLVATLAAHLGGSLAIGATAPGGGTAVSLRFPIVTAR